MTRTVLARTARIARVALIGVAFTLAAVVPPIAWAIGSTLLHVRAQAGAPPDRPMPDDVAPPAHDPSKRTAVVITGSGGAEMTDFLIPYEALATTAAFNVYVVAPERRVIPLASAAFRDGGIDLVPHYTLDEFDRTLGVTPDVIVIPFLPRFAAGEETALVPWIRAHADAGALILSICAGSEVLAATGIVDGLVATTHPSFFARLEARYPEVTWVRDVRFVETPRSISSGAIASAMDATLAAIRRLLGRDAAEAVARELGYAHVDFLDDPAYPTDLAWGAFLGAATSPLRDELGALVYDGVSEAAVGSLFDTFPTTLTTVVRSVGARPGVIRTRHGMLLLPRYTVDTAPELDGLLVPGAAVPPAIAEVARESATARGVDAWFVHAGRDGFPYDGALALIAARDGRVAAEAVAINLNYPTDHLRLDGPAIRARVVVVPLALSALGVLALVWLRRRLRARRARRAAAPAVGTLGAAAA